MFLPLFHGYDDCGGDYVDVVDADDDEMSGDHEKLDQSETNVQNVEAFHVVDDDDVDEMSGDHEKLDQSETNVQNVEAFHVVVVDVHDDVDEMSGGHEKLDKSETNVQNVHQQVKDVTNLQNFDNQVQAEVNEQNADDQVDDDDEKLNVNQNVLCGCFRQVDNLVQAVPQIRQYQLLLFTDIRSYIIHRIRIMYNLPVPTDIARSCIC